MKPVILFDLDFTLFDTRLWLREYIFSLLEEALDVSPELIDETTRLYTSRLEKSTDFNPDDYIAFLVSELEGDQTILHQIIYNPQHFAHSVYPEVKPVLAQLKTEYTLGLFSEGVEYFQRLKFEKSGLAEWFDPDSVFIYPRKLEPDILIQVPASVIVDDKLEVLEVLAADPKFKPVWLNRLDSARDQELPTIHSLVALPKVLTTLRETPQN
jgi:phosphoglycolate phosphatase-like HAD superfamily hydrolase